MVLLDISDTLYLRNYITVYNVTGNFSLGERLKFNGETTNGRTLLDQTGFLRLLTFSQFIVL